MRMFRALSLLLFFAHLLPAYSFTDAETFLKSSCYACHRGKSAAAKLDLTRLTSDVVANSKTWAVILRRVRDNEMPPRSAPSPSLDNREAFVTWISTELRSAACANGPVASATLIRRLNRDEYAATIRDLLNIHINAGQSLPADGAGGEGFDNAAETLFLSPIHAEKYLESARTALHYAFSDPKSRTAFVIADQDARKVLTGFLPRAFRRPVADTEMARYLTLFQQASARGEDFDEALQYALQAVLISPNFLFRIEPPNPSAEPRPLGHFELASRLSYFLWGSMPDAQLFRLAKEGKLQDPSVLHSEIARMLKDPKSLEFCQRFVEQWLGTRELGRDIKPDKKLFPQYYDAELQSAMKYEPILFFQEILAQDLSLLNLIDSNFTILTNKLQKFYGLPKTDLKQQPKRADLPEGSHRGGILGMSAVLAVSSLPTRTSPVLRGKWVLDALLGTPPPPPPPNVPQLEENHDGAAPRTVRERLAQHRANPVCASCHSRIDPIGFGLENYDVLGRWRTEDAGKPIDSKGELPGGISFDGPEQLKTVLLNKKELFFRNLTTKLLGYALGRGLTLQDQCTVEQILTQLDKDGYRAQSLVQGIVMSVPFRYQPATLEVSKR